MKVVPFSPFHGTARGPAFQLTNSGPRLMGVLSAYIPNRATGEDLPGLSVARDISHFHELLKDFKSVEEAKEERRHRRSRYSPQVWS